MSTTTTEAPAAQSARAERLATYRSALCHPDASLDTVIATLREFSRADVDDLAPMFSDNGLQYAHAMGMLQSLLITVGDTLAAFDATTRSAPPAALADVVRDAMQPCVNPVCDELLAPWMSNACSPECERAAEQVI